MRAPRPLQLLERAPWVLACLAALGATLLVPSALALLAPPDLLDALWALGDRRLALLLLGLFVCSAALARRFLRRARSDEMEEEDPIELRTPAPEQDEDVEQKPVPRAAGGHLR
jgi:hypothetical protein